MPVGGNKTRCGCLLIIMVDLNPWFWAERQRAKANGSDKVDAATLDLIVEQLLVFSVSHLMLRPDNRVAFVANHPAMARRIFPPTGPTVDVSIATMRSEIVCQIKEMMSTDVDHNVRVEARVAGALSLSLCYANRISCERGLSSRILVLNVSPDSSGQYVAIMNAIFSAQKLGVAIDVVEMAPNTDAVFLQQASHVTGGIHRRFSGIAKHDEKVDRDALLQYLLAVFLADVPTRRHLAVPNDTTVDLRAACFCHKKVVNVGYVCSVCLSIYCEFLPICSTCGTRFSLTANRKIPSLTQVQLGDEEAKAGVLQEASSDGRVAVGRQLGDKSLTIPAQRAIARAPVALKSFGRAMGKK